MDDETGRASKNGKRRRWLLAIDPVFEGGRRGKRAQAWDVEDQLIAVAMFGDVTIDLSEAHSAPDEIEIEAYALLRDVDVLVPEGTHVELFGGVLRGNLENSVSCHPRRATQAHRAHPWSLSARRRHRQHCATPVLSERRPWCSAALTATSKPLRQSRFAVAEGPDGQGNRVLHRADLAHAT